MADQEVVKAGPSSKSQQSRLQQTAVAVCLEGEGGAVASTSSAIAGLDATDSEGSQKPTYIPIGTWQREGNGATFEAGVLERDNNKSEDKDLPKQLLIMKMDPGFLKAEEGNIIRRRLLFDEDMAERHLANLVQLYCKIANDNELKEKIQCEEDYYMYKQLTEQCSKLKTLAKKNFYAINANLRATKYWELMNDRIKKEINDIRPVLMEYRKKVADRTRLELEFVEQEQLMEKLKGTEDTKQLEERVAKLKSEIVDLKNREKELDSLVKERKTFVEYVCLLVKQLDLMDEEGTEKAIKAFDVIKNDVGSQLL